MKPIEEHNRERLRIIGKFLRDYRMREFMSREYVEENYSISRSVIERAEKGENITLSTLFRLLDAYDIDTEELLTEIEDF